MVNAQVLRHSILTAKCEAEFQVRLADACAARLMTLDTVARTTSAALTIVASFVPQVLGAEWAKLGSAVACLAAVTAVIATSARWSALYRNAITERERWNPIATEFEFLLQEFDIATSEDERETVLREFRKVRKHATEASAAKVELPAWQGIRTKAEDAVRTANEKQPAGA